MGLTVFNNDFDPYDALMNVSDRLSMLQEAHNRMAHAYEKSQHELVLAKSNIRNLQKSHAHLNEMMFDLLNEVKSMKKL
jgi:predicted nuclease with TOPRIM domain